MTQKKFDVFGLFFGKDPRGELSRAGNYYAHPGMANFENLKDLLKLTQLLFDTSTLKSRYSSNGKPNSEEEEVNFAQEADILSSGLIEDTPSGGVTVTPAGDSGATPVTVTLRGKVTVTPSGDLNEGTSFSIPTQPTLSQSYHGPQRMQNVNNSSSLFDSFVTATESSLPLQKWGYFSTHDT